jgi:ankyrin repeat protein/serine/threonine protein kinase
MQNDLLKAISKGESVQQIKDILVGDPNSVHQCLGRPTPLMSAAKYGRHDIIDLLISANSPVDDVDKVGKTALCIAANHGHLNVVSSLISAGADVNHRDKHGATPLMICSQSGRIKLIELLLMNGADRDAIRKPDSKKAIDLTTSTLVQSALLGSYRSVKYRAMCSEGDHHLLRNQLFEFPSRKDRCIRYVTIEQLPEGTPVCEHLRNQNSSSARANKDSYFPAQCIDHGNDLVTSSNSSSSSSSSSSSTSSSSQPFNKILHRQTHLVLKCSTDSDMILRECNLLKQLHTTYGKDAPFIALADGSWTPVTFRQVCDRDDNFVSGSNYVGCDPCGTVSASSRQDIGQEAANMDKAAISLKVKSNSCECSQSGRTWYGLLLERGVCDLNAFGVDVLSERNVRKSANCTERVKKVPRVEGSDGSVRSGKEGGQGQDQGQGQGITNQNNDNNCRAHISHDSMGINDEKEDCSTGCKDNNRYSDNYRDHFLTEAKRFKVALSISIEVCRILSVLHDSSVVWLDVKPSNFVLFSGQAVTDSTSCSESELGDALNKEIAGEVKSVEAKGKLWPLNGNKTKIFKNNNYSELSGDKYSTWLGLGLGPSLIVKAIDLGGCVPTDSCHAASALTFSSKYSPPELVRIITMQRGQKEKEKGEGRVPGSDSGIGTFQVSPSADCWGLGMSLMQIFHRDFRCYFAESNIGDDGNRITCSTQCADNTKSNGNAKIDGISTQDLNNIGSLKGSDAALVRLSVSPSVLQAELERYLGPISTYTTGATHTKTTETTHNTNTTHTTHTTEIRHTTDSTHTIHEHTTKTTNTTNTTNTTHTARSYSEYGNPIGSGNSCAVCVTDKCSSDVDVDVDVDVGSDNNVESSLPSSLVDMKEEVENVVLDEDIQDNHFEAVEDAERAEEMPSGDRGEKGAKVESAQRDRVIALITQLLRVTPSERITAHTALHLLQREEALLDGLSLY